MPSVKLHYAFCGLLLATVPTEPFAAMAATAQSTIRSNDSASPESIVEEVIVTAERRTESLTKVPMSISALTSEMIDAGGIKSIGDIRLSTPGYTVSTQAGFTQMFIRGIGNQIYIADPSVATFIDDVPRNYGNQIPDLTNVERVEILKGAQGGLYGRNATGGVINIITRQPSDTPEGRVKLSYGEKGTLDASAFANVPVNEDIAFNLSLTRRSHDPYVRNLARPNPYPAGTNIAGLDLNSAVNPGRLQDQDLWAADAKIRVKLGDNLKATLAGDYSRKNDADGDSFYQNDPQTLYQFYQSFAPLFGLTPLPAPFPGGGKRRFEAYDPTRPAADIRSKGAAARVDLEQPGVTLTSISAQRWNDFHYFDESTAAPIPLISAETFSSRKTFYQELRAVSNGEGPLKFVTGGSFSHDDFDLSVALRFFGVVPSGTALSRMKTDAYSVYGQLNYDLTDRLAVAASLRYVEEKKSIDFRKPSDSASLNSHKILPSFTVSYDVPNGTAYARYAEGFKSGGVNANSPPALFAGGPGFIFQPEQVDTYEIGYKANLFDRQLQFTSAVFYNKYQDLQVAASSFNPAVLTALVNAGSARTYGAEASVAWRVTPVLTTTVNFGYLDASYQTFAVVNPDAPNSGLVPFDNSGQQMPLAPKWQGSVSAALDQPVGDFRVLGSILYSYTSAFNFDASLNPATEQKSYPLVNARIGLAMPNDHVSVYVFANNVFDKFYAVYGTQSAALGSVLTIGAPRIVGASIEAKY